MSLLKKSDLSIFSNTSLVQVPILPFGASGEDLRDFSIRKGEGGEGGRGTHHAEKGGTRGSVGCPPPFSSWCVRVCVCV